MIYDLLYNYSLIAILVFLFTFIVCIAGHTLQETLTKKSAINSLKFSAITGALWGFIIPLMFFDALSEKDKK